MAEKTVHLSEDAYARVEALKREGESFSEALDRIASRVAALHLAGSLTDEEAEAFLGAAKSMDRRLRGEMNRPTER